MPTSNDLSSGASTAVNGVRPTAPPEVTAADLFPINRQKPNKIETDNTISRLQFPSDLGKYYMSLGVSNFQRQSLMSLGTLNVKGSIKLPLPQQMTDTHNVNYDQQNIGAPVGGSADAAANQLTGGQSTTTNIAQAAGSIGSTVMKAFGGDNVEAAIKAFSGLAPNQFLTVLLQGPSYKEHDFSWKFAPRNPKESESVRLIIATLNNAMAPAMGGTTGSAFFQFPKIFSISFNNPNGEMKYLYKFKPCVLKTMSVNYMPSGAPAFYRQTEAPDVVEIRCHFMELEFWLQGDFDSNQGGGMFDNWFGAQNETELLQRNPFGQGAATLGDMVNDMAKKFVSPDAPPPPSNPNP